VCFSEIRYLEFAQLDGCSGYGRVPTGLNDALNRGGKACLSDKHE
jgi:hypothetical protein